MDDPYLLLGYGVIAYFGTMMHLAKMFCVITLFLIPVLAMYFKNDVEFLSTRPIYARFTLGNIGGADIRCDIAPLENKAIGL